MSDFSSIKWSPNEYQQAAFLAQEVGQEMLSRLDLMVIKPAVIVDAGCGTGEMAAALVERYPAAKVYAVDVSADMLDKVTPATSIVRMQEDAGKLSLPDHSVDLLCANFLLPWAADANACLREWRRVLSPNGLLMLSALGTATLQEIKATLPPNSLPPLIDMHDLGDALISVGFADPVMDTYDLKVSYRDGKRMQQELHASGLLSQLVTLPTDGQQVTFEVVHGHAFTPMPSAEFKSDSDGHVRIPVSHLRRSLS